MTRLEHRLLRVTVLAIILCVVFHFMLPKDTTEAPEMSAVKRPPMLVDLFKGAPPKLPEVALAAVRTPGFTMERLSYEIPVAVRSFGARSKAVRRILANLNGGGDDTEDAVELALGYLSRIQANSGAWSPDKSPLGSTGLALNAFLGAGYHHMDGDYKETVRKGIEYLLAKQTKAGRMGGESLYSSGIAGVVFAEAYGLTGDPRCKTAAEKMIEFLARSQGPKGGWYYTPGPHHTAGDKYNYDTSVTGWVLMAFKSAKMAGLHVPHEIIDHYMKYAMEVTHDKNEEVEGKRKPRWYKGMSFYGIRGAKQKNGSVAVAVQDRFHYTMTASTLMCRLYMGDDRNAKLIPEGLAHLTTRLPDNQKPRWIAKNGKMDSYLWYHAAQVGFLVGGRPWKTWNEPLRKILVENQVKEGADKGRWNDEFFRWGNRSGVYATCLNIMILETYYRYFR